MAKVTLFVEKFIKEELVEKATELYKELIEETRKEEGCITYTLYRDENDKTHFLLFEEWESKEALDAHGKTPHFTKIVPQIGEMAAKAGTFLSGSKIL